MTREKVIAFFEQIKVEEEKVIENLKNGLGITSSAHQRFAEAFGMAASALREQEEQKAILIQQYIKVPEWPRWISVKDRLPNDWKEKGGDLINYLVFMPEYGVDVGNYAKPVKTWLCMGIPCKVTHWMPLPEPPKEEA